jgi:hypothetical protein
VNPLLAALIVVVATAVSVLLVQFIYGEERHRVFTRPKVVLVTLWFLVSYGGIAFLVIPH